MSFNGTPFNDDQLDHMHSIAALPDERVSWCGWGTIDDAKRGYCCADDRCPGKTDGKTRADKIAVWCSECRATPEKDGTIVHVAVTEPQGRALATWLRSLATPPSTPEDGGGSPPG